MLKQALLVLGGAVLGVAGTLGFQAVFGGKTAPATTPAK